MKVGVVGCGAAGMTAAISAARNGHEVTILEHNIKPGKKILVTGNGKCNFTNENMDIEFYNESGNKLFSDVYSNFTNQDAINFFKNIGILHVSKNGYYYPRSEQATAIVNGLMTEIKRLGVNLVLECNITSLKKTDNFTVKTDKGTFEFDRLILATGSKASPKTGSDGSGYDFAKSFGHKIIKPLPALCALECSGFDFKAVAGVRCRARVNLFIDAKEFSHDIGELQLTDYGISGIPVFQISSSAVRTFDAGKNVNICIDFMPEVYSIEEIAEWIVNCSKSSRYTRISEILSGMLNDKLARAIVKNSGVKDEIKCEAALKIAKGIKNTEVSVKGYKGFDNCQVCSGGIDCNEINSTLESKKCKGLYFAGEIIDENGQCGGYNLQWAWSSGYVAGLLG